jgi:predicted SnoaL-like aldol condensation-catalyzing enzyme
MRNLHVSIVGAASLLLSGFAVAAPAVAAEGAAAVTAPQDAEGKKRFVIDFYNKSINQKDYEAARAYLGDKYIQHNPTAMDGPEGLKGFIDFLKAQFPQQHNEIKHAYVDGDFVILHVHSVREPGTLGRAIVDIFRLENGKVVEHWDVIQDVVAPEQARNSNGMF